MPRGNFLRVTPRAFRFEIGEEGPQRTRRVTIATLPSTDAAATAASTVPNRSFARACSPNLPAGAAHQHAQLVERARPSFLSINVEKK